MLFLSAPPLKEFGCKRQLAVVSGASEQMRTGPFRGVDHQAPPPFRSHRFSDPCWNGRLLPPRLGRVAAPTGSWAAVVFPETSEAWRRRSAQAPALQTSCAPPALGVQEPWQGCPHPPAPSNLLTPPRRLCTLLLAWSPQLLRCHSPE